MKAVGVRFAKIDALQATDADVPSLPSPRDAVFVIHIGFALDLWVSENKRAKSSKLRHGQVEDPSHEMAGIPMQAVAVERSEALMVPRSEAIEARARPIHCGLRS